jgi:DNA-binding transcriptional LysR family regulator
MEWSERIGRRIRLRDLHILLTVVQCKSMARAAEQLAISKPVVSKVIADLEHVLGVRLLERDRHGAEPTSYGAALLKRGLTVFDELREAVKDIEFLADPTAGELRIGCNPGMATSLVPAVIDRVSRRFPLIVFNLVVRQAEALPRELSDRNVDILMTRRLGALVDDRLCFDLLFQDREVVAAGAHSPWVRRRRIELSELMGELWTLPPPDHVIGAVAMRAFRACGLDYPRSTVVTDSLHARMSLLATGRFLSIFPVSVLLFPRKNPDVRMLPVDLPFAGVPNGIISLKNRAHNPVARLFVEHARKIVKPLADRNW